VRIAKREPAHGRGSRLGLSDEGVSLDGDEQLDPLPVHINGLWVFARPVIMHRPDGTER
jgi:hypothetical protein